MTKLVLFESTDMYKEGGWHVNSHWELTPCHWELRLTFKKGDCIRQYKLKTLSKQKRLAEREVIPKLMKLLRKYGWETRDGYGTTS